MVKVFNTIHEDYHMHSMNFSDGMNTIDEIIQYANKIWLTKIIITDHSQWALDHANITLKNRRIHVLGRWKNIYNDVDISFGIEWDLINDNWDCCFDIQGVESDFCILSCHAENYKGNL